MAANQNMLNGLKTKRPSRSKSIVGLISKLVLFLLVGPISKPLWPFFWQGWLIWGRPTNVVSFN